MTAVHKIIFTGPAGSGKSCAIRTLTDIEVVATEDPSSDDMRRLRALSSAELDYGLMKLANGDRVRLYATRAHHRFAFMWTILCENALGLVVLLDARAPDPLADLRDCATAFGRFVGDNVVVGITHGGWGDRTLRNRVAAELERLGLPPIVMTTDARRRDDLVALVKTLVFRLDPQCAVE